MLGEERSPRPLFLNPMVTVSVSTTIHKRMPHFAAHGAPQPDSDCIVCCDPLDEAQYCEYQTRENGPWFPCMYCKNCMVDSFLNRQFAMYLDNLKVR